MSNATLRIACPLPSRDVGVRMRRRGRGPAAERVPSAVARGAVAVGRRAWARVACAWACEKHMCPVAYGACGLRWRAVGMACESATVGSRNGGGT